MHKRHTRLSLGTRIPDIWVGLNMLFVSFGPDWTLYQVSSHKNIKIRFSENKTLLFISRSFNWRSTIKKQTQHFNLYLSLYTSDLCTNRTGSGHTFMVQSDRYRVHNNTRMEISGVQQLPPSVKPKPKSKSIALRLRGARKSVSARSRDFDCLLYPVSLP